MIIFSPKDQNEPMMTVIHFFSVMFYEQLMIDNFCLQNDLFSAKETDNTLKQGPH